MADQQLPTIYELVSQAGVKRDGTDFDSQFWNDALWVRFQRGRPRKMGGYRYISDLLYGPVRAMYLDSRAAGTTVHSFSQWGIEQLLIDSGGLLSSLTDRTPAAFVANSLYTWQAASMFQSGGAGTPTLVASASPDSDALSSDVAGPVYSGDITLTTPMTPVQDGAGVITVSGGVCALQPFIFLYGSNGLIRNSNPNDVSVGSGWTTGGANKASTANVAGSKIVKGLAMRGGGQSPAGVFWALDALIKVNYVGGTTLWTYDTISDDVTILSKSCVVEYDNAFYWVGTDRFYVYNGIVQELPNPMNLNWFFDNLNFAQRQKVWALKVPRFGEIWWFFPTGTSTECNAAVIFNVREKLWYDTAIDRTAGAPARVYPRPLMAQNGDVTSAVKYAPLTGVFTYGESVVGLTSGATATVSKTSSTQLNLSNVIGSFIVGETIKDTGHGGSDTGTVTALAFDQQLSTIWDHEKGVDVVNRAGTSAIDSRIESNNLNWLTGSPVTAQGQGGNFQFQLSRVEPDFVIAGSMSLAVNGKSFANSVANLSDPISFNGSTEYVDLREQRRLLTLIFRSNEIGGDFQMGRILLTVEPGDERG